ncbi:MULTISPECIES: radical SAM protein [unclassified Streptomyces]|uniref:SPL family radical SAM protein n=1 Tax=unclassified Streptomyces TaxID=2593676 RepID=UPI0023662501|nr:MULTISPECIES: radical SAM protein [unclassified Streptomyces]MDF3143635.1 radical SAM protein [Streptomyces sp. T21Q-yed]WDF43158.1 radical SAM protein [Streptomyces sp. T12]
MQPVEIEAKTLIQKSKTPSNDYVINPYTGCVLGCAYCFASFAGRQFGRSVKEWGDYLYVKKNAVELAREELARMPEPKRRGTMLLSSVTDPYQGHETQYRLTRGILRELTGIEYPGLVRILTKSPVVTRDIDLLTSLPRAEVGMTVTTADDKVSRWLEVRAPLASRRLRTLAELREAGIPTYAFVGPLLPHFAARPELLDHLFGQLADAGITEVFMEHINLKRYIRERMDQVLAGEPDEVREAYLQARTKEHRERLDAIVADLLAQHGLRLRFDEVVHHDDNDALRQRLARPA